MIKKDLTNKIQLDVAINLKHLTKGHIISFHVKSNNITCTPTDNTDDILNQLYASLLHYYEEKIVICRTDSSYVFHNIEGFSMHIDKTDLRRGSSFIPSPKWLQSKKASINPKNMDDNYCFAYATAIAIYHKELGSHIE